MKKNVIGDGRKIPLDDAGVQAMLERGPEGPKSSIRPEIPSIPKNNSNSSMRK
jgi:hypothetical protein